MLAGLATGMAVMEGADNGMIFSLFIAAFALFVSLLGNGSHLKKIFRGVAMIAVVAVFAGIIAFQTVQALVGTQIVGIVGMEQTPESKEKRWHEATQWSLPKIEMLRVIVPGFLAIGWKHRKAAITGVASVSGGQTRDRGHALLAQASTRAC